MHRLLLVSFALIVILTCAHGQGSPSYANPLDSTFYVLVSDDAWEESKGPFINAFSQFDRLEVPWNVTHEKDGWLWVTERPGRISRLNVNTGEQQLLLHLSDCYDKVVGGLMGMALHPKFESTPYVYIAYTARLPGDTFSVRIARLRFEKDTLLDMKILTDKIRGGRGHDGCRLAFGPDGKLYISTGDSYDKRFSQSLAILNGKILRMNPDGSVPRDNPFPGSYVWACGLRDPQGLAFGPDGTLYCSDHGDTTDDEINIITKGGNYGWPHIEGIVNTEKERRFADSVKCVEPIYYWTPTIAPCGLAFYSNPKQPRFDRSLMLVTLKASRLVQLQLDGSGTRVTFVKNYLKNEYGRLRGICSTPEGRIFVTTSNRDRRNHPAEDDDKILELMFME